jgi:hypothetical protein
MQLGIVFILTGTIWLVFRKAIAQQQFLIIRSRLRAGHEPPEERAKALERFGTMFAVLLVLAGAAIVILYLVTGR